MERMRENEREVERERDLYIKLIVGEAGEGKTISICCVQV